MPVAIENYTFEGPYYHLKDLKDRPGIYAILCRLDNGVTFLIDVGESQEIKSAIEGHERKDCWVKNCKGTLFVAVLYTPELDSRGRQDIETIIRKREFVPCGEIKNR